jgi:hypothetical protein
MKSADDIIAAIPPPDVLAQIPYELRCGMAAMALKSAIEIAEAVKMDSSAAHFRQILAIVTAPPPEKA